MKKKRMIYLDNAATSWPKPKSTVDAVRVVIETIGGNPGRSGHLFSLQAGAAVERGRSMLAKLFHVSDPARIVFALNATDALNLAINGMLQPGDHAITSCMEHNSVTRPLEYLRLRGVEISKIETDPVAGVDLEALRKAFQKNTKLVVMTHVSNVTGTYNPIEEIAQICRENEVPLLVDASQSAGVVDIDVEKIGIDLLAFPGHKSLFGPTGTGGLYIRPGITLNPTRTGGTGIHSENPLQPEEMPYHYEAGTQNVPGIAGLTAGIEYILEEGIHSIEQHEMRLMKELMDGLMEMKNIKIYGSKQSDHRAPVLSFNIDGFDCSDVAMILDSSFGIAVRAGLHCAPDTHKMLGTFHQGGTIRVSPGYFNHSDEIHQFLEAITEIVYES